MINYLHKYGWTIVVTFGILAVLYPFLLLFIEGVLNISIVFLVPLNLPLIESLSSWVTLWGVIAAIIGLYQIKIAQDKQLNNLKNQNKSLEIQEQQLNHQIEQFNSTSQHLLEDRYYSHIRSLYSTDINIATEAVEELYILAKNYPKEYRDKICNKFCSLIRKNKEKIKDMNDVERLPEQILRAVTLLFTEPYIF